MSPSPPIPATTNIWIASEWMDGPLGSLNNIQMTPKYNEIQSRMKKIKQELTMIYDIFNIWKTTYEQRQNWKPVWPLLSWEWGPITLKPRSERLYKIREDREYSLKQRNQDILVRMSTNCLWKYELAQAFQMTEHHHKPHSRSAKSCPPMSNKKKNRRFDILTNCSK